MSDTPAGTLTVIIERELPHPPEKVWRALSQPHLIQEWLMQTDFTPVVGRRFQFRADWGAVDCEVLTVEPGRTLSYTWCAYGLESLVTWTLTPAGSGTLLRMEQSGFPPEQKQAYHGARAGWTNFLTRLEQRLERVSG